MVVHNADVNLIVFFSVLKSVLGAALTVSVITEEMQRIIAKRREVSLFVIPLVLSCSIMRYFVLIVQLSVYHI